MGIYIAQVDLEDRLGAAVIVRLLDDNNDGTADTTPVARVIKDAESYCEGFARGIYDLLQLRAAKPSEFVRLILDVAVGYLAIRHGEYVRLDGYRALDRARAELMDLRRGTTQLDLPKGSQPEPGNQGAQVASSNENEPLPQKFFTNGMGDF